MVYVYDFEMLPATDTDPEKPHWKLVMRATADAGLPETLAQRERNAGMHFGASVSIFDDYISVGAPDYDDVSLNQGAVYNFYFLPDQGCECGGTWTRSAKLVSSAPAENDHFGAAVAPATRC